MDIRALVLVNQSAEVLADPIPFSSLAPGLLEVAGRTPLQRTIERLQRFGVQAITVIGDCDAPPVNASDGNGPIYVNSTPERFWRAAESSFNDLVQEGAELVLLVRLGTYAEIDFERMIQFHLDQHARVTQACSEARALDVFCISASRRNDAASLFRSQLTKCRSECPLFAHTGYTNSLKNARDLRQFAIDILTLKTETKPAGNEVRPGVWVEKGALIEKGARLVAPAFIGAFAKIRTHAVITRCSSVEHHARIDCGTVTENSTVLPYCRVGACMDVAHSVVGTGTVTNLRRDVTVEILDTKLITYVLAAPGHRLLRAAAEFAAYLPKQMWHGIFGEPKAQQQPDLEAALHQTAPALGGAAGYETSACDTNAAEKFPPNLAIVRRYGHQ